MVENRYYIFKDRELWEQEDTGIYNSKLDNLQIIYGDFKLIEDEIDIDSIEEIKWRESEKEYLGFGVLVANDKINELVQAVKQLNKEIKSIKEDQSTYNQISKCSNANENAI